MGEREDRTLNSFIPGWLQPLMRRQLPLFASHLESTMPQPLAAQHPPHPENGLISVTFGCTHPSAHSVFLAGTFNSWNPHSMPLHAVGNRRWRAEKHLPPGTYEYRLIIDGVWQTDPAAKERVANPYGDYNSLIEVQATPNNSGRIAL